VVANTYNPSILEVETEGKKPAWATLRPCFKQPKRKEKKTNKPLRIYKRWSSVPKHLAIIHEVLDSSATHTHTHTSPLPRKA
jgi:hypothetical protein